MASNIIIFLAATFLFATIINAKPPVEPIRDCGPNAVWSRCVTPCAPSCDSLKDPKPIRCNSLLCRRGCNCMEGFIRKSEFSAECVLKENCPK